MRKPKPISSEKKETLHDLLNKTKKKADYQRVQCVWLRASLGLGSRDVATAVGWSEGTVRRVQAEYLKEGEESLIGEGRGGRRHENLTVDEESELLDRFARKAGEGGILVVSEIKESYEKAVGHKVPKSTVYRMLARHGWRKIAPRPRHPKADPEKQEAFKKKSP